ncbi:MAG: polyhydroxyalkanoate synthesis regulator DNA-binding domain-containing protein [Chloracidobacterium sp.]|uniref:Polyhydroxyalkanoate synthesis regulator DNA-binding domain-containing protein n=1 Tax=Chloracidobacterium validum TaxID=2821543 RepID=A0ABX8B9D3_9BACT|nr:polyhydroxyalkanoate synthesis regulator DNA-binding domain-containing protein [Chloracidobacterium validum]QUW02165.1 polyhydroxyalkanoate synthesis regulator DNA-binding domain-containing protein [Chloracidobacterium validum]
MARTIKRYANRKLYDVAARRYVKLDELADFIQAGEEVQVIDKESGEDITEATLSKIAAATVRQPTEPISRNALVSFIRQPGDLFFGYMRRTVSAGLDTVHQIDRQFERLGAMLREALRPGVKDTTSADELAPALRAVIEAFVAQCVAEQLSEHGVPSATEFARLQRRVTELEKQLGKLTRAAQDTDGIASQPAANGHPISPRKRVRAARS